MDDDELSWMFKDIQKREKYLSEWEESFVADVHERHLSGRPLTEKQEAKFNDIYEKVTENG